MTPWHKHCAAFGCGALLALLAPVATAMTLSQALQHALAHDPSVALSLATYEADREAGHQERGSLLPNVAASGALNLNRTKSEFAFGSTAPESYSNWNVGVEARQPLFRLDWFARGDRADALDNLADAGLHERKLSLLRRVADRYFGVLLAQDDLAQAEMQARAVQESMESTRKRYEVDLVPGTDLREAQARNDLTQAQVLAAQHALESAQDALDEVTGRGREPLPALIEDAEFPALLPATVESWLKYAQEHNPALIRAREQVAVAQADVRSRYSATLPTLDAIAGASHADSTRYSLGQLQDDMRIGLQLNIPIFSGGILASRARESEARERAAKAEWQRLSVETHRQIQQRFRDVQTGYAEARAYRRALESARTAETATRNGYEAGTRTITDVLDARSRVAQATRDLHRVRYTQLLHLLQLKQIAGVLSEKDFQAVDQFLSVAAATRE